jgi:arginase
MIVDVFGAPSDLGANIRGANMGPAAIRIAGLHEGIRRLGHTAIDHGDLAVDAREQIAEEQQKVNYLPTIAKLCSQLSDMFYLSKKDGNLPLLLGGDHSLSIGSIAGMGRHAVETGKSLGIIWVDAHADMNTPQSSQTQNIHGMPLAAILGDGHPDLTQMQRYPFDPKNVALIGLRDIDGPEKDLIKKSGIHFYTMREVDEKSLFAVIKDALGKIKTDMLHVSFDMDAVDPLYAPGVSTAVTGGLSYREAHLILEVLADDGRVAGADFMELNPIMDHQHKTARFCVELVQSLMGKSIV